MNNIKKIFYANLTLICVLTACEKEDEIVKSADAEFASYSNLKVGNYWVYEEYGVNTLDESEWPSWGGRDSIVVEKDTIINNRTYFIQSSTKKGVTSRAISYDSANTRYSYPSKQVIFSMNKDVKHEYEVKDGDVVHAHASFMLIDKKEQVTVPAGTFETINYKGTYNLKHGDYKGEARYFDRYYAQNIGLVKSISQYVNKPSVLIERRLVKYGKL